MSAHKKNWVFRDGIDNPKYLSDANHGDESCTSCHGGTDGTDDRAVAHAGMRAIPSGESCEGCHTGTAASAQGSLHTTLAGYEAILADRGFDFTAGTLSRARYDKQCTKCHAAVETTSGPETACGHCHVSVPDTAGGGLVAGHRMSRTPDMVNNCTACHGSRVKDEFFGLNDALYTRNRQFSASLAASDPFGGAPLAPDVHYAAGMTCAGCHTGGELHGAVAAGLDRYGVGGSPDCRGCHGTPSQEGEAGDFHTTRHLDTMSCQICHSQPYKNCFSCHTQETPSGVGFFVNNVTDPTRAARFVAPAAWAAGTTYAKDATVTYAGVPWRSLQAANTGHTPDEVGSTWWKELEPLAPGDALMTFRAGKNPRFGVEVGAKKYAVLRHVPVDADTFTYDQEGEAVTGLIPGLSALPTWKYATPHNIARTTAVTRDPDGAGSQTACGNCHSARYSGFWLTDPTQDAHGWVPASSFEVEANAGVVQPAPISPSIQ